MSLPAVHPLHSSLAWRLIGFRLERTKTFLEVYMFRLIKLSAYVLLGYAIYNFFSGLFGEMPSQPGLGSRPDQGRQQSGGGQQSPGIGGSQFNRPRPGSASNPAGGVSLTGPGEGIRTKTADVDGGSMSHKVGRGVVHT